MIEIAKLPADDRRELFHNTAAKTGLHDAIVEKDFWVCLTLDYLFHRSPWKEAVTFKGGEPVYPKGIILSAGSPRTLILSWIGVSWDTGSMNPGKNARTQSRMPSIKRRIKRPRFSWQKPSARRSGKGFLLNWGFRQIFT